MPPPKPIDDDPYIPRRRRREYDDDRDLRRPREERTILEENAREHMRVAGYAMLAAAIITGAVLLINHAVSFLQGFDQGRGADLEFALFFGIGCSVTFYLPMLVFVVLAGRDLLRLGPRGMIVTGIVMAFILSALFALGVLLQIWLAQFNALPNSPAFLIPKFVLSSMDCVFNLVAAILAMRALSQRDVARVSRASGRGWPPLSLLRPVFMRLRCPHANCPIEVPDDLVGVRIRCPHCSAWLVVDAKYREASAHQIQEGIPPPSLDSLAEKPSAKEVASLENQIYDGLPPLSVMLALRQRRDYDRDDLGRRFEMTDDDWTALAAFEKVMRGSAELTTAFWIGSVTLLMNVIVWASTLATQGLRDSGEGRLLAAVVSAMVIGVGLPCLYFGRQKLRRLEFGDLLEMLPWYAFGLGAAFGVNAVLDFQHLFGGRSAEMPPVNIFSIAANGIACLAACSAAVFVWVAIRKVRPPEIAHRLTEALKYLD